MGDHPGLALYGIESYVAVPLHRRDGELFGTLCALDSVPADLEDVDLELFRLLADLIAFELEALDRQREQEAEAARRESLRQQVLDDLSHDLKNPLAAIAGQVQLLQRGFRAGRTPDPARLVRGLEVIAETTERITGQLDGLLAAARARQIPAMEAEADGVDLVAAAARAVAAYQPTTARHVLRLATAPTTLVGPWDADGIDRMLANLLTNAIKYSPDGGPVTLEAAHHDGPEGTWAVLRVRDDGIGIPAADLTTVFERSRRAANAAGFAGSGIGLAVVREVAERHGGSVAVESAEGCGSTFTVRLPIDRAGAS